MRIVVGLSVVLLLVGSSLSAAPKNVVGFQPFGIMWGLANIEFEHAVAPKVSFAVRGNMIYRTGTVEEDDGDEFDAKLSGFGGGGSIRFYPLESAPKRAYAGIDIDVIHVSGENEDTGEEGSATLFGIGGVVGWKWLIADAFAIALDVGTQYFAGSLDIGEADAGVAGLIPKIDFYIGIAF